MTVPIRHPWHIAVLIPARDEEKLLPRCLRSLQAARSALPPGVTSDVIIVCDGCSDRTAAVAQQFLGDSGFVIATAARGVGYARAMAAQAALSRYIGPRGRCWLANTDADCNVPSDWLTRQLASAANGFTAITGIVTVDSFAEHAPHVAECFRLSYHIHPDGTHPHVHGANLGIRADVYLQSGGWGDQETAEDHDLWNRLKADGHRCLTDARLSVITSGRRQGRAALGFADALAVHNEIPSPRGGTV